MRRLLIPLIVLAGCSPEADATAPPTATAATVAASPTTATGTLTPEASSDTLQWAASVVQLDSLLPESDAKVFGLAGGDPALNGTHAYLAFYLSPADGWRVFSLGDWRTYEVTGKTASSVTLGVLEDGLAADGVTLEQNRRQVRVTWTPKSDDTAPDTVTAAVVNA